MQTLCDMLRSKFQFDLGALYEMDQIIINVWRRIYSWVVIKNVIGSTVNFNAFTSSGEHFINVINTDKKTNLQ